MMPGIVFPGATGGAVIGMYEDEDELHAFFHACDTNRNGTLQFSEFVTLLENLGAEMEAEACLIGFREIDTDRDGRIDFGEFRDWWTDR
jgi:calmodulin